MLIKNAILKLTIISYLFFKRVININKGIMQNVLKY